MMATTQNAVVFALNPRDLDFTDDFVIAAIVWFYFLYVERCTCKNGCLFPDVGMEVDKMKIIYEL